MCRRAQDMIENKRANAGVHMASRPLVRGPEFEISPYRSIGDQRGGCQARRRSATRRCERWALVPLTGRPVKRDAHWVAALFTATLSGRTPKPRPNTSGGPVRSGGGVRRCQNRRAGRRMPLLGGCIKLSRKTIPRRLKLTSAQRDPTKPRVRRAVGFERGTPALTNVECALS
jgi:hypothetical protein